MSRCVFKNVTNLVQDKKSGNIILWKVCSQYAFFGIRNNILRWANHPKFIYK